METLTPMNDTNGSLTRRSRRRRYLAAVARLSDRERLPHYLLLLAWVVRRLRQSGQGASECLQ